MRRSFSRRRDPPVELLQLIPLLALLPAIVHAHFSLTFPETRYPPFDFLDTQRTVGPCGIPKSDRSFVTKFQTGKPYKISWRMAMEHKGTFRLRLLDSAGKALDNWVLRPNGTALTQFTDGTSANSVEVQFPSDCRNCTLLMEKEAPELGEQLAEKGCAEVDISAEPEKPCLGKGKSVGGHCQCEQGFSGDQCQYRDDCTDDGDCGHGGRCVAGAIHHGQRSCFCPFGFIGTNCERKSGSDPKDSRCFSHGGPLNGSSHSNSSQEFVYGLFNPNCYSSKELNSDGDRLYWRLVGNQLELLLDFRANSWVSLGWRPLNIPPSCRLFPQIHAASEGGGRHGQDGLQTSGFAKAALDSPLHPMDCSDVIMASVLEGTDLLHIADMYSRDRSSPLRDAWLDGEDSLSAAYGLASDGRMVVMFRRMVPEIEPTDHPLGPGKLFLIWAKGQSKKHKDKGFYSDGQWKYHGDGGGRGHLQLEFVSLAQMGKIRGPLIHLDPPPPPAPPHVPPATDTIEQRTDKVPEEGKKKVPPTTAVTPSGTKMENPQTKKASPEAPTTKSVFLTTATTQSPTTAKKESKAQNSTTTTAERTSTRQPSAAAPSATEGKSTNAANIGTTHGKATDRPEVRPEHAEDAATAAEDAEEGEEDNALPPSSRSTTAHAMLPTVLLGSVSAVVVVALFHLLV
uniref:EGF-like domain-containing protein n=1 Tax=Globodera rostochiensis TaxID=31243 RepID=A0A914ID37_GLORO